MDAYFPVTKSSATGTGTKDTNQNTKREDREYKPYTLNRKEKSEPSAAAVTKFLLSTLGDESNPITHSDSGDKQMYCFSTSTGHQVSEGAGSRAAYLRHCAQKTGVQRAEAKETGPQQPQVLVNVKCYISGYLENTTDMEMKRIIISAGGKVLASASQATHIITSQHMSGSKTQHLLNANSKSRVPHVVKPEWVMDSIAAGKRRCEREYSVIKNVNRTIKDVFSMSR
ncbi:BRCT domain-containing protein [Mycena sanguinolenta]|uniref:BRCT domain-containing protein n=1 Tax=Mycena sanguinolenta TaxID=230812 RepID=A0A8H6YBN8_9AGAR|nr:BRCT domain-containing protein [Mycena sanguinolenta]